MLLVTPACISSEYSPAHDLAAAARSIGRSLGYASAHSGYALLYGLLEWRIQVDPSSPTLALSPLVQQQWEYLLRNEVMTALGGTPPCRINIAVETNPSRLGEPTTCTIALHNSPITPSNHSWCLTLNYRDVLSDTAFADLQYVLDNARAQGHDLGWVLGGVKTLPGALAQRIESNETPEGSGDYVSPRAPSGFVPAGSLLSAPSGQRPMPVDAARCVLYRMSALLAQGGWPATPVDSDLVLLAQVSEKAPGWIIDRWLAAYPPSTNDPQDSARAHYLAYIVPRSINEIHRANRHAMLSTPSE